jgi:hypothetical protein
VGFENEKVRDESMEAMEGTPLRRSLSLRIRVEGCSRWLGLASHDDLLSLSP